MSDAVMWKPSSYSDSIKFYERMSQLQGELKTYESQHFNLEEEFQRLWTQDTSVPVSASGVEPKTTTRVQLGHLSEKSQLLANPTNTNPRNYEDQDPRRARNASILDKLQELETNASIFAARSERLRMMRNEYENLVRKYSTHRNHRGASESNFGESRSLSSKKRVENSVTMTSTSSNTDITGPVTPILNQGKTSFLNIDIPLDQASEQDSADGHPRDFYKERNRHHRGLISISGEYPINGLPSTGTFPSKYVPSTGKQGPTKKLAFQDDISSTTSESADLKPEYRSNNNHPQKQEEEHFDETSADTTSLSVLLPKSRGSNYILSVSTDGSLSDSTSIKHQQQQQNPSINARNPKTSNVPLATKESLTVIDVVDDEPHRADANGNGQEITGKTFPGATATGSMQVEEEGRNHVDANDATYLPDQEGDHSSMANDSSLHSIGDSLMDSTYHKNKASAESMQHKRIHDDDDSSNQHNITRAGNAIEVKSKEDDNNEVSNIVEKKAGLKSIQAQQGEIQQNISKIPSSSPFLPNQPQSPRRIQTATDEQIDEEPKKERTFDTAVDKYAHGPSNAGSAEFGNNLAKLDHNSSQIINMGTSSLPTCSDDGELHPLSDALPPSPRPPLSITNETSQKMRQTTGNSAEDGGADHSGLNGNEKIAQNNKIGKSDSKMRETRESKLTSKIKSRRLKLNFDDSESDNSETERERGNPGKRGDEPVVKGSSLSTSVSTKQVPTKEELDAEFEDFFG